MFKMAFPARIDYAVFLTADGRLSTEAQALFVKALDLVQIGRYVPRIDGLPGPGNSSDLRQALAVILCAHRQGIPQHRWFTVAGFLAGSIERGLWLGSLKARIGGLFVEVYGRHLERCATKTFGANSAGWNYYHLARWLITGNTEPLEELHARALYPALSTEEAAVQAAAAVLIGKSRAEFPDFHESMRAIERAGGRRAAYVQSV